MHALGVRAILPVLFILGAADAFWEGFEQGRTVEPTATVDPAVLSEAPSTDWVGALTRPT